MNSRKLKAQPSCLRENKRRKRNSPVGQRSPISYYEIQLKCRSITRNLAKMSEDKLNRNITALKEAQASLDFVKKMVERQEQKLEKVRGTSMESLMEELLSMSKSCAMIRMEELEWAKKAVDDAKKLIRVR